MKVHTESKTDEQDVILYYHTISPLTLYASLEGWMTKLIQLLKYIVSSCLECNTHIFYLSCKIDSLKCNITKRLDSSVSGGLYASRLLPKCPLMGIGHVLLNTLLWGLDVQALTAD